MSWHLYWLLLFLALLIIFILPWYVQTLARAWTLGRLEGVGMFTKGQIEHNRKERRNGEEK